MRTPFRFHRFPLPETIRILIWISLGLFPSVSPAASGLADESRVPTAPAPGAELPATHAREMARGLELFKSRIRGLLLERCVRCHGGERTQHGLDLSTREALLRGGESGVAVVPRSPGESRLLALVSHSREPHMPHRAPKLADADIEALGEWIALGAPFDGPLLTRGERPAADVAARAADWWAFRPLASAPPPAVRDTALVRNPVDQFWLHRLEARGLTPNPESDALRLVRRLFLDLTGMPPTPAEADAFAADPSDAAFGALVDRLLASTSFGERWARHWLDVARFAESHGFEHDYDRPAAYPYRDFVIRALAMDLPFDEFLAWQIAGDEIAPENPLAQMATGFLGAGVFPTQITLKEVERTRYDALDDMAATTSAAFLGLTLGCARCHDHKYDPIPTREYYEFVSTFTTTVRSEVELDLDPAGHTRALEAFEREHAPLAEELARYERDELPARLTTWMRDRTPGAETPPPRWQVLEVTDFASRGGASFERLGDGSLLVSGANPDHDTHTLVAETRAERITGLRLEALAHESMVRGGPGRASNGNFGLGRIRLRASPLEGSAAPVELRLESPRASFEQNAGNLSIAASLDEEPASGWAVDPQFGRDHAAVFALAEDLVHPGGARLEVTLEYTVNTQHAIGRPRLSVTSAPRPIELDGESAPAGETEALAILSRGEPLEAISDADRAALLRYFAARDAGWLEREARVRAHLEKRPAPTLTKVQVTTEGLKPMRHHTQGADFFDVTHVLQRGDTEQKQEIASQGFLSVLTRHPDGAAHWRTPAPEGWRTSYRRRALADWLVDVESGAGHLVARVAVNRIWQHHFGRGIVSTPNDFGLQGMPPSHPELLDWLARELIDSGWRMSHIHRLILGSSAYRRSSAPDRALAAVDPTNELLWRFEPRRLEAEAIRDSLLFVSGALDARPFGPGTLDESMRRRSIYFTIKRSRIVPFLQLFDFPEPLVSQGTRPATTIAPQALLLMNNPSVREWARAFAARLRPSLDRSPDDAVLEAYRLALVREPTDAEREIGASYLRARLAAYAASEGDASERALVDFAQGVLSLSELIYIE